jgi:uncharacterized protein YbjT (DUF2867 family)
VTRAPLRCLVAGGSGVTGARLLHHLLADERVGRVTAVGRKPLALRHARLVSVVADLTDAASIGRVCPDEVDVAFCALGTTIRQAKTRAGFRSVDHDAVVAFATAARRHGAERFLLVSSLGASSSSLSFYLRTKGEAEDAVVAIGFPQVVFARPSILDDEGTRRDRRIGEKVGLAVMRTITPIIGSQSRSAPIRTDAVARALVRLAFDPGPARVRIVLSDELHRLGDV